MKPEMKHCAGCRAPNPAHLTTCYACGRLLDQAAPPPTRTYPCRACEQPVPFAAPVCPHCGLAVQADVPSHGAVQGMAVADVSRVADALQRAASVGSIGDWELEPLPDGTTRLRRGTWARLTRANATNWDENMAFLGLLLATALCFSLGHPRQGPPRPLFLIFAAFCGASLVLLLLWMLMASETLRVGPQLLERRRGLGSLQRVQRWEGPAGGTFRVSQWRSTSRNGSHSYRSLRIVGTSGSATLDSYEQAMAEDLVPRLMVTAATTDEAGALGRFLSHLTGWPLLGS